MGDRSSDIVPEEATIKGDRFGEQFHAAVSFSQRNDPPRLSVPLNPLPVLVRSCLRKLLADLTQFRHVEQDSQPSERSF